MEFPPLPRRADRHLRVTAAALIVILVASIIGAVVWSRARDGGRALASSDGLAPAVTSAATNPHPSPGPARADSYAETVERVAPAVVTVHAERASQERPGPHRGQGLGSGVLVTTDGHLLTNHHLIDGAARLQVELADRRRFVAQVVGVDPPIDLAVLKIDATGLPAATFGNSERVRVGDVVLALGNPRGIGPTVTLGIVSATNRSTGLGDGGVEDFLQTDAAINAGNAGGALVNARGELVGINAQILTPSGGNIGIGVAIPVHKVRSVLDALRAEERARRP